MNILIVEDNLAHQRITEYALKRSSVPFVISVVRDGQDALDYLFCQNEFADKVKFPSPDIILLDLNLPKRDGREVLQVIKSSASLKDIPVIIVSTSDREEDVSYASQMGVVAYISKSSGFDKFVEQLANITQYVQPKS